MFQELVTAVQNTHILSALFFMVSGALVVSFPTIVKKGEQWLSEN